MVLCEGFRDALRKSGYPAEKIRMTTNRNDRWFFVFGFEKNERVDISENELESLKKVAKDLLGLTAAQIAVALGEGSLVEVEHEA